ncbi:MAG: pantoate--beta-alanine ligase [Bacteroidota bacterium]
MRAITAPGDILKACLEVKKTGQTIGLVPTMGALHAGHLSLVEKCRSENDVTVVSIFVNPIQFNKKEDLDAYPRNREADLSKLDMLDVDLVFLPEETDFYPELPQVSISFGAMENVLEGAFRPNHFAGVGVVVSKLFHLTQPDKAYFGLKDLQQFLLIKRMVKDLDFPIELVGVETKREKSGLAMSSRNLNLSQEGMVIAANIFKGLMKAGDHLQERRNVSDIKSDVLDFYHSIAGLDVEYLEIVNTKDLSLLEKLDGTDELAVCFAGYVEGVRLIDNLYLQLN